ncbi:MAG: nucleotidyltransferase domain-containing protein [Planctomycetes bacterium]|nr:nucleotidyltransferase domain-containing protein [Planctomycetota bacterium]
MRGYVEGFKARAALREEQRSLEARAGEIAVRCAERLRAIPEVRRVVLYGSLAKGTFHQRSDIDIAVEGLPMEAHFRVWAELERDRACERCPRPRASRREAHGFPGPASRAFPPRSWRGGLGLRAAQLLLREREPHASRGDRLRERAGPERVAPATRRLGGTPPGSSPAGDRRRPFLPFSAPPGRPAPSGPGRTASGWWRSHRTDGIPSVSGRVRTCPTWKPYLEPPEAQGLPARRWRSASKRLRQRARARGPRRLDLGWDPRTDRPPGGAGARATALESS